jgi:hypothetical protein
MNISIDDLNFGINQDVKKQTCNISNSSIFFEYHNQTIKNENIHYFYLFESCFDSAFAHWIFESAIYLPYFIKLKSKYPKLKLLVKKTPKRSYKNLFFKALNIDENDIFWLDNMDDPHGLNINYDNIPENNICINTMPHYLNTVTVKNTALFKNLIVNFKNKIINNLNITLLQEKTNEHLFFPRSKLENFVSNDRTVDYTGIYKILKGKEYIEYDTNNTIYLKDQIELLNSSKNIYLDWGSSLFVNSLFCINSNIFISGSKSLIGQLNFEGMKILYDIHKENNNIQHIS